MALLTRVHTRLATSIAFAFVVAGAAAATPSASPTPAPGAMRVFPADATRASTAHPERWPRIASPVPRDAALERRIDALMRTMTLEEKVGQVIQADLGSITPDDLRTYRLGSVLAGGNSDPGGKLDATPARWRALADAFHAAALDTSGGGKPIPLLLGIDAVHGHNNVAGATLFPHNIGLGATQDPALLRRIGEATAAEVRATGFDWTFAPTLAVPQDLRWGRTYEGFSGDPARVAADGAAEVEGLQGKAGTATFLDRAHVLATAKHFIGDGGTTDGKDTGNTQVDEATLRDLHGRGHVAALRAGVQTVMASFSSWNGQKMHGNGSLLTGVLKQRMDFDGFVVGDWNGHGKVPGCSNEDCPAALVAGVDMLMAPDTWKGAYAHTLADARDGTLPMARLDDAVRRILRVKFRLGLFDAAAAHGAAPGLDVLGSAAHRALARQAVRESLVLLKNAGGVLPIDPRKRVLVAGDGADDIARQSGGWTLGWQGAPNTPANFPHAQSIWSGLREAITAAGGHAELSADGRFDGRPDVAIVVFGETPYAEFLGDIPSLAYQPGEARDLALLRRLRAAGVPVVSVFLSGRPLWVNREINASDAFVAAWLPGSEGGGVADVLLRDAHGAVAHDFRGTLPFAWPARAAAVGRVPVQFPVGRGLRYAAPRQVGALPEISGLGPDAGVPGNFFGRGMLTPGWSWQVADGVAGAAADPAAWRDAGAGPAAHVRLAAADRAAQEDARRLVFDGPARVRLHGRAARDLSRDAVRGDALVLALRVDAPPAARVRLGVGDAWVVVDDLLRAAAPGTWTSIGVPLACFQRAGADLSRVVDVAGLASDGPLALTVSGVALGATADHMAHCEH